MKPVAQYLILFFAIGMMIVSVWMIRGDQKEQEFADRMAAAAHKSDTVRIVTERPEPPRAAPPKWIPPVISVVDRAPIDSAFWAGYRHSIDSVKRVFDYIAAPIDTVITFDSVAAVPVKYTPITRMLNVGLLLSPHKETVIRITDSAWIPMPDPDSWTTRAGIFVSGAAFLGAVMALTR